MVRLTQLYIYFIIILLLCCYWLLVSASKDHHQANIYRKKTQNAAACSTKTFILRDPVYNYYQPLEVLSVASCVVIL